MSLPRSRLGALAVAVATILQLTTSAGYAAPIQAGDLDEKFGGDGTVTTATHGGNIINQATDVVVQPDGRIVVVGWTNSPEGRTDPGTGQDLVILRYDSDGELDSTFAGGKGIAIVPVAPGANFDVGEGVALQPDGKIVVAGTAQMVATGVDFFVARFNPDGTLDATFDGDSGTGNGIVTIPIAPGDDTDRGMDLKVVPGSNDILVAGWSVMPGTAIDSTVVRLKTDGTLDQGFDGDSGIANGKVTIPVSPGVDRAEAIALSSIKPKAGPTPTQPPGKTVFRIVLAGVRQENDQDTSVVRLTATGKLDTSFNGTGIDVVEGAPVGKDDMALDVLVQPGGGIVTTGYAVIHYGDLVTHCGHAGPFQLAFALTRHLANGKLDPGFGGDGIVTTIFPGSSTSRAQAIVRQSDGKYVVGGFVCLNSDGAADLDYGLARYFANGTLDKTFGGDGLVTTAIAPFSLGGEGDEIYGLALQADGKIVAAGYSHPMPDTGSDHSAARYHAKAQ